MIKGGGVLRWVITQVESSEPRRPLLAPNVAAYLPVTSAPAHTYTKYFDTWPDACHASQSLRPRCCDYKFASPRLARTSICIEGQTLA